MKWFGESWGAPVNKTNDQVDPPLGLFCAVCSDSIKKGERGLLLPFSGGPDDPPDLPYHLKCFLGSVVGESLP